MMPSTDSAIAPRPAAAVLAVSEDVYACLALHLESLEDRLVLDVRS